MQDNKNEFSDCESNIDFAHEHGCFLEHILMTQERRKSMTNVTD